MFHKDIHILLFTEDPFFCRSDPPNTTRVFGVDLGECLNGIHTRQMPHAHLALIWGNAYRRSYRWFLDFPVAIHWMLYVHSVYDEN